MTGRDAQAPGRFEPRNVPDVALTLKDSRIAATGSLRAPRNDALVARAVIAHDLGSGRGKADLAVPGLSFGPGLQPEDVTRLALGVVANVTAQVSGEGHIRWNGTHVTRSEEHTSELQSLMRISYAVFCLKKKKNI